MENIVKHITVPGLQQENLENHCCQTTELKCGKGKLYTAQCDTIYYVSRRTLRERRQRKVKNCGGWGWRKLGKYMSCLLKVLS